VHSSMNCCVISASGVTVFEQQLLEGVQIHSVVSSTAAPSAATLMKTASAAAVMPGVTMSSVTIPAAGNTVNLTMAAHQKLLAGLLLSVHITSAVLSEIFGEIGWCVLSYA